MPEKLMAAEDIVEDLEESGYSPMTYGVGQHSPAAHEWRAWMLTTIRDIQRNAKQRYLEAAARAVCSHCAEGVRLLRYSGGLSRHVRGTESHPCVAAEILDLIPETPAPAGKETNDAR